MPLSNLAELRMVREAAAVAFVEGDLLNGAAFMTTDEYTNGGYREYDAALYAGHVERYNREHRVIQPSTDISGLTPEIKDRIDKHLFLETQQPEQADAIFLADVPAWDMIQLVTDLLKRNVSKRVLFCEDAKGIPVLNPQFVKIFQEQKRTAAIPSPLQSVHAALMHSMEQAGVSTDNMQTTFLSYAARNYAEVMLRLRDVINGLRLQSVAQPLRSYNGLRMKLTADQLMPGHGVRLLPVDRSFLLDDAEGNSDIHTLSQDTWKTRREFQRICFREYDAIDKYSKGASPTCAPFPE